MDKVLTRKLFKDRYLQTISKKVSNFKEGGLASLRAKHFFLGGESSFTPGERKALIAAPFVSKLLEGTRQPGQSQASAIASNIGKAIPDVINTAIGLGKIEKEGKGETFRPITEADRQILASQGIPLDKDKGYQISNKGEIKAIGGTGVTVNTGERETTEQKEYGKLYAEKAKEIFGTGTAAANQQNTLSILRQATNQPDLQTGSFGEFRTSIAKIGQEFGLDLNTQNIPAAEVLQSFSGKLVLDDLNKFKGSISDGERRFVVDRTPGLTTSKEGINTILDIKERANELAKQFAIETESWIARNEGLSKKDKQTGMTFSEFESKFQKDYPLLTDELKTKIDNASRKIDPQFSKNVVELEGKRYIQINGKPYQLK